MKNKIETILHGLSKGQRYVVAEAGRNKYVTISIIKPVTAENPFETQCGLSTECGGLTINNV